MGDTITCSSCARAASSPLTARFWSVGIRDGRREYCCERCSRENLRQIEARLNA